MTIAQAVIFASVLLTFVTSVIGFLSARRKVAAVQVTVDGRMSQVVARVDQLEAALRDNDVPVPHTTSDTGKGSSAL